MQQATIWAGPLPALLIAAVAFLAAAAATTLVERWLRRRAILDRPNERSSHSIPTPRGGGLALLPVLLAAWAALAATGAATGGAPAPLGVVMACLAGLALVSWLDDVKGLPAAPRFLAHALAVAVGLALLPADAMLFQGLLPFWADRLLGFFCWAWLVNLWNFVDGINGITGTNTLAVGAGAALVAAIHAGGPDWGFGLVLAAVAGGFLLRNWHPASIFLGDVGSVPLGYAVGWLLAGLAASGAWQAALLLPLIPGIDATLTLLRRTARGARPWEAHREHAYQRATQRGLSPATVCRRIAVVQVVLVLLAVVAVAVPAAGWVAVAVGLILTLGLLRLLGRGSML